MNKSNTSATDGATGKKLEEAILFVANQCKEVDNFGTVKLYKILFFADRELYRTKGRTITEGGYVKRRNGPVQRYAVACIANLEQSNSLVMDTKQKSGWRGDYTLMQPMPLRESHPDALDNEEVEFLIAAIRKYAHMSARKLSRMTHELPEWRWASMNGPIDVTNMTSNVRVDLSPMSGHEKAMALQLWQNRAN